MALYHHWLILRDRPGGTGQNSVSVQAYRHADDSTIGSPVVTATVDNIAGSARFLLATTVTTGSSFELHPGPYYLQLTHNGETQNHSSRDVGSAGVIDLFSQLFINRAMGNGIIQSPPHGLNELAVTADGLTMTVAVATGGFTVQGVPGFNHLERDVDIAANASGNPRIDTVVLEVVPGGNATEGKVTLKVVAGTPGAVPVAPTLTQSAVLWQEPLADVAVANGAVVIQLADVTDRRDLIERAVSDVEDDITALDLRVDTLEAAQLPRQEIVATYVAAFDPPSMTAATWNNVKDLTEGELTFHNGYVALDFGDKVDVSHSSNADQGGMLFGFIAEDLSANKQVEIYWVNYLPITINPSSGTLTVVVKRLVTV